MTTTSSPQPFAASRRRPRVLLGITGSVAAVKGPELAIRLSRDLQADVKVLLTRGGDNFWTKAKEYDPHHWFELQNRLRLEQRGNDEKKKRKGEGIIQVISAEEEWNEWNRIGDPVMHIELRDWADVVVIAPLSAHTLAKIANGLCDDTLSCVMRAWDYGHVRPGKPIILAPAMNTAMWEHPLTRKQLDTIVDFAKDAARRGGGLESSPAKVCIVEPQEKTLACGEVGTGALASVDNVIMTVQESLASMDL